MACKVATGYEMVLSWLTEIARACLQERAGGCEAPPFADLLFREMIWEEHEAARAEREVAAAEGRVESETAIAEQRRLMAEVFELKLQLAEEKKRRLGVPEGSPGLLDYVVYPEVPSKVPYRAVLLLEATV